jgi:hypothetical protein
VWLGGAQASVTRARLLFFAVLLGLAVPVRAFAQEEDKPLRRPRLEYTRGPGACTHEDDFETEIYLITRLEPSSDTPDVVRVWCSKGPMGFTCRVQYINAAGEAGKIERIDGWDCWRVAREAAVAAAEHMPKATCPKPPPCPDPVPCPSCPAPAPCRCPPQRACPLPPKPEKTWYRMSELSLYAIGLLTGGLWAEPGGAIAAGVEVRGDTRENPWMPAPALALELRFASPGRAEVALPFDPTKPTGVEIRHGHSLIGTL